ncbi:MAG: hypothetical protein E6Q48_05685 [Limnohabitans sp.]|nr:MAG: hypothetical protein E6Q48_05685 [Limnohabitans sp.]
MRQDTRKSMTIRLSPDVPGAFRSTGQGWQTRVDAALRDLLMPMRWWRFTSRARAVKGVAPASLG